MSDTKAILRERAHRPWPMPSSPWVMFQSWQRQLFAHWPIPADVLRPLVPPELALDSFDGQTYVGVTPFDLCGLRFRWLPRLPVASHFAEVNVRTYVRVDDTPGVFFFSLDAASWLAVMAARATFHLPYFAADMHIADRDGGIVYESRRRSANAELIARYRPIGAETESFIARPGTLDHFLIERYALYVVPMRGRVLRGDIHHAPWRLRPAIAEIERNTIPAAHRIALPPVAPLLHYSARQDTVLWPLIRVR
jgi:uncharacterized protein YqjF (DUF2071 family)